MKINKPTNQVEESTYALITRSEEKNRTWFEMIIYGLIILSAIAAILQFTEQRDPRPLTVLPETAAYIQLA